MTLSWEVTLNNAITKCNVVNTHNKDEINFLNEILFIKNDHNW